MNIVISEDAFNLGISEVISLHVNSFKVGSSSNALISKINQTIEDIKTGRYELERSNIVDGSMSLFKNMGYQNPKPVGPSFTKRVLEKGYRSINSVVDAYNEVSMLYSLGIGGHCMSTINKQEPIIIEVSSGEHSIQPLFCEKKTKIKQGDLIYRQGDSVLAAIGKKDIDSEIHRIRDDSDSAFFLLLGNIKTDRDTLFKLASRISDNLSLEHPKLTCDYYFHSVNEAGYEA